MRTPRIAIPLLAALTLAFTGCGSDKETVVVRESPTPKADHARDQVYFFSGHIYDGTSNARLTSYSLDILYKDQTLSAKVDGDGRYSVGPLPYFQDYTVRIQANGYRPFMSHNEGIEFEWYDASGNLLEAYAPEKGFYFNAYLYPDNLTVGETTIYVTADDTDAKPSGNLRVIPTTSPMMQPFSLTGLNSWENSGDLEQPWIVTPLTDGVATIEEGKLLYGVEYMVLLTRADAYYPEFGSFTGGVETLITLVLQPVDEGSPELVYASIWNDQPSKNGEVFLVFDRPIELDPRFKKAEYIEFIEAGLAIQQEAGGTNALNAPEDGRGVSLDITDNILTLKWNAANGLDVVDDDHAITRLTYGGLNQVRIRSVGASHGQGSSWTTLASEWGSNTIEVDLVP